MANLEEFDFSSLYFEDSSIDLGFASNHYYTDAQLKSSLGDDPFLNTLTHESNVLGVVDLPQNHLESAVSPDVPITNCNNKSSPWHESDSGVSDTTRSIIGSPEHLYDHQSALLETDAAQDVMTMNTADEALDNELAAYLNNTDPVIMQSPSRHSNASSDDLSFFANALDKEPLVDIISDDDFLTVDKTSFKTIHDPTSNTLRSTRSTCSGPSEVKILKVVRPSNAHAGVTSEDIAKAMDERSKKNATQAKMNRERKKAYIQSLENEVADLKSSNDALKSDNATMKREMGEKDEEIDYLKSVLANSSALSGLLKNITGIKEVKLSATIMARKRAASGDHCYNLVENTPQKRARLIDENLKKAGVCLHVTDGSACLEFCAHCSKLAQKSHAHS